MGTVTGKYNEPPKVTRVTGQGKTRKGDVCGTHKTDILDLPADDMSPEMPRGGKK